MKQNLVYKSKFENTDIISEVQGYTLTDLGFEYLYTQYFRLSGRLKRLYCKIQCKPMEHLMKIQKIGKTCPTYLSCLLSSVRIKSDFARTLSGICFMCYLEVILQVMSQRWIGCGNWQSCLLAVVFVWTCCIIQARRGGGEGVFWCVCAACFWKWGTGSWIFPAK